VQLCGNSWRLVAAVVLGGVVFAGCAGSERPSFGDDALTGSVSAEATLPDNPARGNETAPIETGPTPAPTGVAIESEAPPPPTIDDFGSVGNLKVTIDGAIVFEVLAGCDLSTLESWTMRYRGVSDNGIIIEVSYDSGQPDFAVFFADARNTRGGLAYVNSGGGDDILTITAPRNHAWTAEVELVDDQGQSHQAKFVGDCV
jgi:hypothetical protein